MQDQEDRSTKIVVNAEEEVKTDFNSHLDYLDLQEVRSEMLIDVHIKEGINSQNEKLSFFGNPPESQIHDLIEQHDQSLSLHQLTQAYHSFAFGWQSFKDQHKGSEKDVDKIALTAFLAGVIWSKD